MRIGLVVTGGVDASGRECVIPALLWLIERLARVHDLHVFALRQAREPRAYPLLGATVHDLGRVDGLPGLGRLRQHARLLRAVETNGPFDLLHAYWGVPAGLVATDIAARLGVPAVVTFDSGEFVSLPDIEYGLQRRWIDRRAIARTARRARRITVCSEYMARLAAGHGIRVEVLPLGVDSRSFVPVERENGPPWRLLHVASLNRVKDQETLFRALARVVTRLPQVHLDVAGEDTLNGLPRAMCARLGLDSHVTFHGFQPTDLLVPLYQRAHLHLLSSRHEAAGVVSLEAAASGLMTVGTSVGYVADWAEDRAVAVPVRNADALADSVVALLGDTGRRTRLASAARSWALAHDADWTARQFEKLYSDLAEDQGAR
jgi:glycosyltransferase involved in cell wall biosynthesis